MHVGIRRRASQSGVARRLAFHSRGRWSISIQTLRLSLRHESWEHHLTLLPGYNLPLNATVRCAVLHVMCLQASPKDSASVRAPTSRAVLAVLRSCEAVNAHTGARQGKAPFTAHRDKPVPSVSCLLAGMAVSYRSPRLSRWTRDLCSAVSATHPPLDLLPDVGVACGGVSR